MRLAYSHALRGLRACHPGKGPFALSGPLSILFVPGKIIPGRRLGDLMPHTRSAKKSLRKNQKRRLHNRAIKRDIKEQIKTVLAAVGGPIDQLRTEFNLVAKKLDKAAAKRVVHPNLAARKKSQLARLLHAKETGAQPAKK